MDAERRHRTLQLLGIELRATPRDGDGDGFYSPFKGAPDGTPIPPAKLSALHAAARRRAEVEKRAASWHGDLTDVDHLVEAVASGARNLGELHFSPRTRSSEAEFGDGTDGVVTRYLGEPAGRLRASAEHRADSDQMASTLANAIGIPAPRILRLDVDRTVSDPVAGPPWDERESLQSDAGIRLGLLDLLAGVTVRDPGTIAIGTDGVIPAQSEDGWRPYDLARGGAWAPRPSKLRVREQVVTWTLFASGGEWRDNPLTEADIEFLRDALAAVESDFEYIGREEWWQFTTDRLDALAEHARGTRNLFAPSWPSYDGDRGPARSRRRGVVRPHRPRTPGTLGRPRRRAARAGAPGRVVASTH